MLIIFLINDNNVTPVNVAIRHSDTDTKQDVVMQEKIEDGGHRYVEFQLSINRSRPLPIYTPKVTAKNMFL